MRRGVKQQTTPQCGHDSGDGVPDKSLPFAYIQRPPQITTVGFTEPHKPSDSYHTNARTPNCHDGHCAHTQKHTHRTVPSACAATPRLESRWYDRSKKRQATVHRRTNTHRQNAIRDSQHIKTQTLFGKPDSVIQVASATNVCIT